MPLADTDIRNLVPAKSLESYAFDNAAPMTHAMPKENPVITIDPAHLSFMDSEWSVVCLICVITSIIDETIVFYLITLLCIQMGIYLSANGRHGSPHCCAVWIFVEPHCGSALWNGFAFAGWFMRDT